MFQGTTTCCEYKVPSSDGKTSFTIIDTPGFDSSPRANLAVLKTIAEKLAETTNTGPVSGVIYFHRITDLRLTGPASTHISILEHICGESFYPRVAFVTSMWNRINQEDASYKTLEKGWWQLQQRYSRLGKFFEFDNGEESARTVLEYFSGKGATTRPTLQLEMEVCKSGAKASSVRKTQAGKRIERDMDRGFCTIL